MTQRHDFVLTAGKKVVESGLVSRPAIYFLAMHIWIVTFSNFSFKTALFASFFKNNSDLSTMLRLSEAYPSPCKSQARLIITSHTHQDIQSLAFRTLLGHNLKTCVTISLSAWPGKPVLVERSYSCGHRVMAQCRIDSLMVHASLGSFRSDGTEKSFLLYPHSGSDIPADSSRQIFPASYPHSRRH